MMLIPGRMSQTRTQRVRRESHSGFKCQILSTALVGVGVNRIGKDHSNIELCESVAAILAPILYGKYQNDRHIMIKVLDSLAAQYGKFLGPRHIGYKSVAARLALVIVFFAVAKGELSTAEQN